MKKLGNIFCSLSVNELRRICDEEKEEIEKFLVKLEVMS